MLGSLTWGTADFAGGFATRKHHQFQVILLGSLAAIPLLVGVALWQGESLPDWRSMLWAVAAGITGAFGLAGFYVGLAYSSMAIVAPIAAVVGATLPMTFGILTAGLPGPLQLVGLNIALLGIWLATQSRPDVVPLGEDDEARAKDQEIPSLPVLESLPRLSRQRGVVLAVLAGISFGVFLTMLAQVERSVLFGSVALAKASACVVMVGALTWFKIPLPTLRDIKANPAASLSGAFDAAGNVFYLLASGLARLDMVVVLASMGPAWTVLLARFVIHEHIRRTQWLGLGLCLLAIGLLSG